MQEWRVTFCPPYRLDVPLSSLPVPGGAIQVEAPPRRTQGDYQTIEEGDNSDSISIDSYALAMEAGG